ncbi:MAG: transporter substrate-binding domain-containing protein [Opitutae bacterium]|nr:transporter substrate-binding domain-containing protein [Opitutae bacterium]
MNRKIAAVVFALLPALLASGAARADPAAAAEPAGAPILSGCEPDYPPYCFVTGDGHAHGFSVELLRAALRAVGREVEFKTAPWTEIKEDLAEGRLQVLPLVGRTPEREAIYDFTFPYLTMHGTLVVRAGTADIQGPADLKGKQVAVLQGDNAEEYLLRAELGAEIVPRPSFETALRELSEGKYAAVVIQKLLAFQLMQQAGLTNLAAVGPKLYAQNFCFATRKGDNPLLAALNEGLSIAMADGTFRELHAKWFSDIEAAGRTKSRIIVGGDHNYPPYEFLDRNGQPAGFNVDLTRAIARHLGLSIDIQLGSWGNIRKGLEAGEIDAVQGMFYSVARDQAFDFSPAGALVQHVIVVRAGSPAPADLKDLAGKSILVMAGDIMEDLAVQQGYGAQLVAVESQEQALRQLAAGTGDCALVAKVPARYWIQKNGWRGLKVSDHPVLSAEYCYAVPNGRQELISELSEGLAVLKSTGEYREIQAKWLSPYDKPAIGFRRLAQIVLLASLPLLALLLASILWSRALQRRVVRRTRELQDRTRELQKANSHLDQIVENLPTMLFLKDAQNLRFVTVNRSGETLMGYPRIDMLGKSDYDFFPKEQADFFTQKDREVLHGKTPVDIAEEPLQSKTQGERILHTRKVPILNAQGEPEYLLGISEDITDRKRAEEAQAHLQSQLNQAQKMESVGRLAGGVAHDFNNMLQAILGHAELALDRVAPEQPLHADLLEIQKAARRSADLTRQLLAFARKQTVMPKVLDLNETVEGMLKMLRRLIGEDIELAWRPGGDVGPVKVDPSQIDQILANLCVNARDAIAGAGKITIETGTATLDATRCAPHAGVVPGEYVRLAVRDTGCGMDPATLANIFEPFYTTKGMGEGTGLGLATVYGAVKQNNGLVSVDSEPGQGTTFQIYLPRHMARIAPVQAPEEPAEPIARGQETVLLVEDEPAILETTRAMLEKLGYRVLATPAPEEAIHLVRTQPGNIHLLMTDVVMPGMNGRDLAKILSSLRPNLKQLFMSGYTANVIAHHGVLDEGMHFIQKPFAMRDLAAKLRETLAGK